jgi:hypothetical protein
MPDKKVYMAAAQPESVNYAVAPRTDAEVTSHEKLDVSRALEAIKHKDPKALAEFTAAIATEESFRKDKHPGAVGEIAEKLGDLSKATKSQLQEGEALIIQSVEKNPKMNDRDFAVKMETLAYLESVKASAPEHVASGSNVAPGGSPGDGNGAKKSQHTLS